MFIFPEQLTAMTGNSSFPNTDWRFNEFPNPSAHALYVTSVELMSLPLSPKIIANNLLDVITKGFVVIPLHQIQLWINAIGLTIAALPESYWVILHERIIELIKCQEMCDWRYSHTPFQLFSLSVTNEAMLENKFSLTLAIAHAVWYHAGVGQIMQVPQ